MESLYLDYTTGETFCQDEIELKDGKRKWKERKTMSKQVAMLMRNYDKSRAEKMYACGTYLKFWRVPDGSLKLHNANFCRERLCPMCQWRRSIKLGVQSDKVYKALNEKGYRHIFVTLTLRNCKDVDLSHTIDHLLESLSRLKRTTAWKKAIKGTYRALEVTYNKESDTYHPHIHMICTVEESYFSGNDYLSKDKLIALWRRSAELDYDPSVSIEVVKQKPHQTITSACVELCKYPVKSAEIDNWHVLMTIDYALRGRKLIHWSGVVLQMRKLLEMDDVESGNMIQMDGNALSEKALEEVIYVWRYGLYVPYDVKRVDANGYMN